MGHPLQSEVEVCRSLVELSFARDEITVARIVGSIASGDARPESDIDVIVCLAERPSAPTLSSFREGYFDMHRMFGREPDKEYPGEIIHDEELTAALRVTLSANPSSVITTPQVYDGIVWAGMLVGNRIDLVHEADRMHKISATLVTPTIQKWTSALGYAAMTTAPDKWLAKKIVYAE